MLPSSVGVTCGVFVFGETLRLAFASIVEHRLRAALTALGIVFATAAVIAVVALVQGTFAVFSSQLEEIGAGFVFAFAGNADADGQVRATARLTPDDARYLEQHVDDVVAVTPFWGESITVTQHGRSAPASLVPVTERYPDIQSHFVDEGRFFTGRELRERARVAVIGRDLVDELGLGRGVNAEVRVFGTPFRVVGVLERRDGMNAMGQRFDRMVIVPHATALQFSGPSRGGLLLMRLNVGDDADEVARAVAELRRALRRAHRLRSDEPDDFTLVTQSEVLEEIGSVASMATWVVVAILGVALLVGGIGIMNIMLVSVTERTREIGLRMALGARRQDVLAQFLVEAGLIGVVGAAVGVATGVALAVGLSRAVPDFPEAQIAPWSVMLAFVFSTATGLVFGAYPALRAARLDPSEALRSE